MPHFSKSIGKSKHLNQRLLRVLSWQGISQQFYHGLSSYDSITFHQCYEAREKNLKGRVNICFFEYFHEIPHTLCMQLNVTQRILFFP